MDVQVNVWAVLVAALSAMVVGSIWYSPKGFAPVWSRLARIDSSGNRSDIWKPLAITVVVVLITAYVLAHVAYLSNQFFHHSFFQDAVTTAFWVWLGFDAARFITHDAFEGRPALLTLINVGNDFVTIMLMGLIIGWMGV
jgi:ABC-type Fe3+ transport system permease subunit